MTDSLTLYFPASPKSRQNFDIVAIHNLKKMLSVSLKTFLKPQHYNLNYKAPSCFDFGNKRSTKVQPFLYDFLLV